MERRTLPALAALVVTFVPAVLAAQFVAAPASYAVATAPDPELVAEAINDGGVYVDSAAKLFADDAAKDRLRGQLKTAKKPVYVAVLPPGSSMTPTRLYGIVKRKGTFAVLNGSALKASSNVLPAAQLRSALAGAEKAHHADPAAALVSFVRLTNGVPRTAAGNRTAGDQHPHGSTAPAEAPADASAPPVQAQRQANAPQQKSGGSSLPLIGGAAAVVVIVAAGGFFWWRRRNRSGDALG
jgi:hypothetical protein